MSRYALKFNTGVGKSRFRVVHMEKDMQAMIITIALLTTTTIIIIIIIIQINNTIIN
jgi:hypothetical protein